MSDLDPLSRPVNNNDVESCLLAMRILDASADDLDHLLAVARTEYDPVEVLRWMAFVTAMALNEVGATLTNDILAMVEGLAVNGVDDEDEAVPHGYFR